MSEKEIHNIIESCREMSNFDIELAAKLICDVARKDSIDFLRWCKKEEWNDRLGMYEEDCFYGTISKYDTPNDPITFEQLFNIFLQSRTKTKAP